MLASPAISNARSRRSSATSTPVLPLPALVREQKFHYAEVTHAQMEPNCSLAEYDAERDRLTLHTTTQVPYYVHLMLAQCLHMAPGAIRVIKPFVGGGFGQRTEALNFELIAGLLARAARGTVKLELSREETLLTHRGRPETDVRLKIGLTKNGEITAVECEAIQRGGAYAGYGLVTILYAGALLHALYRRPRLALSRPARLCQYAAVRGNARPRLGGRPPRVRIGARCDGGGIGTRSVRRAPRQSADRAGAHDQ